MCTVLPASIFCLFFFNDPATTELYTLSLHDAFRSRSSSWSYSEGQIFLARDSGGRLPFFSCSQTDRKSTRLNSSHVSSSYAVFCLKTKNTRASLLERPHNARACCARVFDLQPDPRT